jgi:hypothetical protein
MKPASWRNSIGVEEVQKVLEKKLKNFSQTY